MKLTVDYLLDILDEVAKNTEFDYVRPGASKVKLLSVNKSKESVSLQRVTGRETENAKISRETLSILANSITENEPFSIESVLKGSGNKRSVYEAILARTSEFYKCTVGRIKHLVWVPSQKHSVNELVEISLEDLKKISNSNKTSASLTAQEKYRPYITAIKSKPFLLLAGISGTGKSRIVRELARACWDEGSTEFKAQKPKNFEMVQVKPNWHDSSELIGYVSRIDGVRYVVGPFLKFMVKAINDPDTPYFLCLDEMNLAPVEQYFAEFLSVVESRKRQEDGTITTDPIVEYSNTDEYKSLIDQLFPNDDTLRSQYLTEKGGKRLSIPTNLIVVGTVNMDETTFSFSRKVLDRAMTIEMNEVDLYGGLDDRHEKIGKLEAGNLIGTSVEGVDVYRENKEVCDTALKYLQAVNLDLDGTPFKVAYRTRNEFLLYVVNNLPYNKDKDGKEIPQQEVIARALDEITSMKILSRIEGDSDKIGNLLEELGKTVSEQLNVISGKDYSEKKNDGEKGYSVSLAKLEEMEGRLKSGYTSFWS